MGDTGTSIVRNATCTSMVKFSRVALATSRRAVNSRGQLPVPPKKRIADQGDMAEGFGFKKASGWLCMVMVVLVSVRSNRTRIIPV